MAKYKVIGSKGNEYEVVIEGIRFSCTCMAGAFGTLCKHVRQAAKEHGEAEFNEVMTRLDLAEERIKTAKKESDHAFDLWRKEPCPMYLTLMELACKSYRTESTAYEAIKAEYGA